MGGGDGRGQRGFSRLNDCRGLSRIRGACLRGALPLLPRRSRWSCCCWSPRSCGDRGPASWRRGSEARTPDPAPAPKLEAPGLGGALGSKAYLPPPGGMCLVLRGLTLILSAAPASDAPCTLEGLCLWSPTWPVPWGFLESRAVERSWVGWCRCSACAFGGGYWVFAWPPAPQMPHFPGAHLRPGRTPWW